MLPRTLALNVQLELAAIVAPLKERVLPPPVAVARPPAQVVAAFGVEAISRPAGSASTSAAPVSGIVFPFVIVTVRVVLCPGLRVAFPNALLTVGFVTTKSVAFAAVEFGIP